MPPGVQPCAHRMDASRPLHRAMGYADIVARMALASHRTTRAVALGRRVPDRKTGRNFDLWRASVLGVVVVFGGAGERAERFLRRRDDLEDGVGLEGLFHRFVRARVAAVPDRTHRAETDRFVR